MNITYDIIYDRFQFCETIIFSKERVVSLIINWLISKTVSTHHYTTPQALESFWPRAYLNLFMWSSLEDQTLKVRISTTLSASHFITLLDQAMNYMRCPLYMDNLLSFIFNNSILQHILLSSGIIFYHSFMCLWASSVPSLLIKAQVIPPNLYIKV